MPTSPPSLPFHLDNRRYKCDTALGAGTFGRVFAATDQHLDIRVAIKTFANGVLITDVLREARMWSTSATFESCRQCLSS
jgi:serine/threonine protein kinase